MPNFVLTRTYRVQGSRKLLEERIESRNRKTADAIYDKWWLDPLTIRVELIERKMDSTELIRENSR